MTQSTTISENIAQVQLEIADACARVGRDAADVTLVAVSKRKPASDVLTAIEAGLRHFGENRVEEAQQKIPHINAMASVTPTWHMIGHVQNRKAKFLPRLFQVVHSVDSVKLAEKLSGFGYMSDQPLPVLLEMNVSGEASKQGFAAAGWQHNVQIRAALWEEMRQVLALPGLEVRGLMTMAPFYDNMEQARPVFAELAKLRATLREEFDAPLPELSMGMTNDYPVAIEEGATIVRIGRAIFGERDY